MLPQQHIDQANHNIKFLSSFYKTHEFNDWAITVAFYASIHIIEASIHKTKKLRIVGEEREGITDSNILSRWIRDGKIKAPQNFNNTIHNTRLLIVTENFDDISAYYEILYNDASTARYKQFIWEDHKCNLNLIALNSITEWAVKKLGFQITTFSI